MRRITNIVLLNIFFPSSKLIMKIAKNINTALIIVVTNEANNHIGLFFLGRVIIEKPTFDSIDTYN
jgi:hypothetical protein